MATLYDLPPASELLSQMNHVAGFVRRFLSVVGGGTEPYKSQLDGAITATATTAAFDAPPSGTWATTIPNVGTIKIDEEDILYYCLTGDTIHLLSRGANGTRPMAHADNAPVYLPCSFDGMAERLRVDLVGDGSSEDGIGSAYGTVIAAMLTEMNSQKAKLTAVTLLAFLVGPWIDNLDAVSGFGGSALVTTPSYGAQAVSGLAEHLRYLNDKTAGTAYSCMAPYEFAEYYQRRRGRYLYPKSVMPPRTTLASGSVSGATAGSLTGSGTYKLKRANSVTNDPWSAANQGVAGMRLRLRCTAAGTAAVTVSVKCEGMDASGDYFGRNASAILTFGGGVTAGDTVVVGGVTFTATSGSPATGQFQVGGSAALTSLNFVTAFNANATLNPYVTATDHADGTATLAMTGYAPDTQYAVTTTGGHVSTDRLYFGGGGEDYNGSDVTPAPKTFTNATPLDCSAVGNIQPVNCVDGATIRALEYVSTNSVTVTGGAVGEAYVLEAFPDYEVD